MLSVRYLKEEAFMIQFGARLKALRIDRGFSQEQFAMLAGVPQSQIARTQLGQVNTSISHVALYARSLEVDVRELFDFS